MNTIRELKQQEKYKTMLKRKNKEKKIYKDKNASLQFEKQKLYRALLNREKEIERLNNIINELEKDVKERIVFKEQEIKEFRDDLFTSNYEEIEVAKNEINIRRYEITELKDTLDKIGELKGSDKE